MLSKGLVCKGLGGGAGVGSSGRAARSGGSGAETSAYGQRGAHTNVYMELLGAPSFLRKWSILLRRRLYLLWLYDLLTMGTPSFLRKRSISGCVMPRAQATVK